MKVVQMDDSALLVMSAPLFCHFMRDFKITWQKCQTHEDAQNTQVGCSKVKVTLTGHKLFSPSNLFDRFSGNLTGLIL
jgi:hypothetical protein